MAARDPPAEPTTCTVCLTAPPVFTLRPCGHTPLCARCAVDLPPPPRCPLCRALAVTATTGGGAVVDLPAAVDERLRADRDAWAGVLQVALVGAAGVGKGTLLRALCLTFPLGGVAAARVAGWAPASGGGGGGGRQRTAGGVRFVSPSVYAANARVRGRPVRFYEVPLGQATTAPARRAIVSQLASPPPHVIILVAALRSVNSLENVANWDMFIRNHPTWSPSTPPPQVSSSSQSPPGSDDGRGSAATSPCPPSSRRRGASLTGRQEPPSSPVSPARHPSGSSPTIAAAAVAPPPPPQALPTTWAATPPRLLVLTTSPHDDGGPTASSIDVRQDVPAAFPAGGVGGTPIMVKSETRSGNVGYGVRRLGHAATAAGMAAGWPGGGDGGGGGDADHSGGLWGSLSSWWLRNTLGRMPPGEGGGAPPVGGGGRTGGGRGGAAVSPRRAAPARPAAAPWLAAPGAGRTRRPDDYGPPTGEIHWS
ncbi:hypothetical protein BU14_0550s0010 [Porphyra umbilicalis]|uniref:RING-type domain-containing protein n=1 Tax=Porphyra umbilicalis TaxID=2786 RepID=A0A1X6NRY5_PORUM|nr:hypothetical protein BU14_0550s0010 [Porphyra umbilicalis]|eukprot:OSX71347.1 hypothetical protein BU14_0550s0010 [Porphyra umbilicalis]